MIDTDIKMLRLIRLCGGICRYKITQHLTITPMDAQKSIDRLIDGGQLIVGHDRNKTGQTRKQWLYVQDAVQRKAG